MSAGGVVEMDWGRVQPEGVVPRLWGDGGFDEGRASVPVMRRASPPSRKSGLRFVDAEGVVGDRWFQVWMGSRLEIDPRFATFSLIDSEANCYAPVAHFIAPATSALDELNRIAQRTLDVLVADGWQVPSAGWELEPEPGSRFRHFYGVSGESLCGEVIHFLGETTQTRSGNDCDACSEKAAI